MLFYRNDNKNSDHTIGVFSLNFLFCFFAIFLDVFLGISSIPMFEEVFGVWTDIPDDSSEHWTITEVKWICTKSLTHEEQNQQLITPVQEM